MDNNNKYRLQINHFNFSKPKIVLIEGAMGTGKTEYCSNIVNDSLILKRDKKQGVFCYKSYDRINVMYLKNKSDVSRFQKFPKNSIAHRNGYIESDNVYIVENTNDIIKAVENDTVCGTIILDEACFYNQKALDFLIQEIKNRHGILIFTSLVYNFKKEFFNNQVKKLTDIADEIIQITGYCSEKTCIDNSCYSYRFYNVNDVEIPAPYFDPTIIVGGETVDSCVYPNYRIRCEKHHYNDTKDYTLHIISLFEDEILLELRNIKNNYSKSILSNYQKSGLIKSNLNLISNLSERLLLYLLEKDIFDKKKVLDIIEKENLDLKFILEISPLLKEE